MKKKQRKKEALQPEARVAMIQAVPHYSLVLPFSISLLIAVALLITSYDRNRIYKTPVTMWADAASKSVNKRRTHENYGQALSTAGFYNDAIREFKTVLALKDDGSVPMRDVYREIGVVYFRVGLIDDAIKSWQTGLQHAPFDASLLNNLSVAFLRQQRIDEAEKSIRQALMAAPNMPQALNSLGEILMIKGKFDEALRYFLKAIEVSPEVPARYWNAALAFEKTGKYQMALEYANRYSAIEPNPELKQRGVMYVNRLQTLYSGQR